MAVVGSTCKCYDGTHTIEPLKNARTKNALEIGLYLIVSVLNFVGDFACTSCAFAERPGDIRALYKETVKATTLEAQTKKCQDSIKKKPLIGCASDCLSFCPTDIDLFPYYTRSDLKSGDNNACPVSLTTSKPQLPVVPGETGERCTLDPAPGKSFYWHPQAYLSSRKLREYWLQYPALKDVIPNLGDNMLCNKDGTKPREWYLLVGRGPKSTWQGRKFIRKYGKPPKGSQQELGESEMSDSAFLGFIKKLGTKAHRAMKMVSTKVKGAFKKVVSKGKRKVVWLAAQKILKMARTWLNSKVDGREQSTLGHHIYALAKEPLEKFVASKWDHKAFNELYKVIWQRGDKHRRTVGKQILLTIMRLWDGNDYKCTKCGPRWYSDFAWEYMCALFFAKALQPGYLNAIFPTSDRANPNHQILIGKFKTEEFYKKGGLGGQYVWAKNYNAYHNAEFVQFYSYDHIVDNKTGEVIRSVHPPPRGVDPFADSACLLKGEARTLLCSTCCCKGGLTKADMSSKLIKTTKGANCDIWFGLYETVLRIGIIAWRTAVTAEGYGLFGRCME